MSVQKPVRITGLDTDVKFVKGVGDRLAKILNRLGVFNVRDLFMHYPGRYEDRTKICPIYNLRAGEPASIQVNVLAVEEKRSPKAHMLITKAAVCDDSGIIYLTWFNQSYIKNKLIKFVNKEIIAFGTPQVGIKGLEINNPEWEEAGNISDSLSINRIVPIYPLTDGLHQGSIRRIVHQALDKYLHDVEEILPDEILDKRDLIDLQCAVGNIHFPESKEAFDAARYRLVYEEFFLLQLALAIKKHNITADTNGIAFKVTEEITKDFFESLPFTLTNSQRCVINDISRDMSRSVSMNRLLQGDVGSGKTVVAAAAIVIAIKNGYQAAIMAPTEILAEQHYNVISKMLEKLGIKPVLLTSSITAAGKRKARDLISSGEAQVVIGTHALIQDDIDFNKLGLAVIDEQHRFGVLQRVALKEKGWNPDVLVMTATPIPRTLALTVYGDLDISVIDELPPGRKPIRTHWKTGNQRNHVYQAVRKLVNEGRQIYIVCPLIEESEKLQAKAAKELAEHLANNVFPDLELQLLHGQMKPAEKEEIMRQFRDGEINILVSTTVIEVGVDVPNACVMVVEDAERFGLAQLHQLRGRVGRGEHQSFCVLIADPKTEEGRDRLNVMVRTTNGFEIAEEDLRIRGPGEFYGTRQSGIPSLRIANILRDVDILEQSREDAFELVKSDSYLKKDAHQKLRKEIVKRFNSFELVSLG